MSGERTTGSGTQGESSSLSDAFLCALLPGACVARVAESTADTTRASYNVAVADASASLGATATGASAGLADAIRASVAPVGETASAVRYASVAATVLGGVVLVLAAVAVAWYMGLIRR